MHSATTIAAALLGLSVIAAAAPASSASQGSPNSTSTHGSTSSTQGSGAQKPFDFPLQDGFPDVSDDVLNDIENIALGTLSNAPPPPKSGANDTSINELAFVAFNELFEVAFFTSLITNISNDVPGFETKDITGDRASFLEILKVHLADEELHELNANGAFKALTGGETILPCEYIFPSSTFNEAIAFASTFTDVVLSTLPDIQTQFGLDGDIGLIRGVGLTIGNEGEQNGFYRTYLGLPPAQLPFLSGGAVDFAFNAIVQNNIVPGSCSQLFSFQNPPFGVGRTLFNTLTVATDPSEFVFGKDITAKFVGIQSIPANNITKVVSSVQAQPTTNDLLVQSSQGIYLTYLNQVNLPLSVPVEVTRGENGNTNFEASFPASSQFLSGLVIAAITNKNDLKSPDEVAAATLFGPALIEVNVKVADLVASDAAGTQTNPYASQTSDGFTSINPTLSASGTSDGTSGY
ncbi:hypothetical protein LTR53_004202 [Teratosphaeriaceae sp. CCFEE 6253]|nr:hypothetical protein LTR53_004202 [Teratosphaeriaceae sp. CCFEE 6253]